MTAPANGNPRRAPVAGEFAYSLKSFAVESLNKGRPPPKRRSPFKCFFDDLNAVIELAKAVPNFSLSPRPRVVNNFNRLVDAVASRCLTRGIRHGPLRRK